MANRFRRAFDRLADRCAGDQRWLAGAAGRAHVAGTALLGPARRRGRPGPRAPPDDTGSVFARPAPGREPFRSDARESDVRPAFRRRPRCPAVRRRVGRCPAVRCRVGRRPAVRCPVGRCPGARRRPGRSRPCRSAAMHPRFPAGPRRPPLRRVVAAPGAAPAASSTGSWSARRRLRRGRGSAPPAIYGGAALSAPPLAPPSPRGSAPPASSGRGPHRRSDRARGPAPPAAFGRGSAPPAGPVGRAAPIDPAGMGRAVPPGASGPVGRAAPIDPAGPMGRGGSSGVVVPAGRAAPIDLAGRARAASIRPALCGHHRARRFRATLPTGLSGARRGRRGHRATGEATGHYPGDRRAGRRPSSLRCAGWRLSGIRRAGRAPGPPARRRPGTIGQPASIRAAGTPVASSRRCRSEIFRRIGRPGGVVGTTGTTRRRSTVAERRSSGPAGRRPGRAGGAAARHAGAGAAVRAHPARHAARSRAGQQPGGGGRSAAAARWSRGTRPGAGRARAGRERAPEHGASWRSRSSITDRSISPETSTRTPPALLDAVPPRRASSRQWVSRGGGR